MQTRYVQCSVIQPRVLSITVRLYDFSDPKMGLTAQCESCMPNTRRTSDSGLSELTPPHRASSPCLGAYKHETRRGTGVERRYHYGAWGPLSQATAADYSYASGESESRWSVRLAWNTDSFVCISSIVNLLTCHFGGWAQTRAASCRCVN